MEDILNHPLHTDFYWDDETYMGPEGTEVESNLEQFNGKSSEEFLDGGAISVDPSLNGYGSNVQLEESLDRATDAAYVEPEYIQFLEKMSQTLLRSVLPEGQDTIRLYRGTSEEEISKPRRRIGRTRELGYRPETGISRGDYVLLNSNPLTSWTTKAQVAYKFGRDESGHQGVVLAADIPIEQVLTFFFVYSHEGNENEFLIGSTEKTDDGHPMVREVQVFDSNWDNWDFSTSLGDFGIDAEFEDWDAYGGPHHQGASV